MKQLSLLLLAVVLLGCVQQAQQANTSLTTPTAPSALQKTSTTPPQANFSEGDCGFDFNCFIIASKNCSPANMTLVTKVNLFGVVQTTTSAVELNGLSGFNCLYFMKYERIQANFSQEFIERLRKNGFSDAEIVLKEKDADKLAKQSEGLNVTCYFNPPYLSSMLSRWKNSEFLSTDLQPNNCDGVLLSLVNET